MGTWNFAFFLQEKLHAHKIPHFRGGGILGFGGEGPILFFRQGDFSANGRCFAMLIHTNFVAAMSDKDQKLRQKSTRLRIDLSASSSDFPPVLVKEQNR